MNEEKKDKVNEEKTISEEDLEGLLDEAKGNAEPVVESVKEEAKESEIEIGLETEKEGDGIELEVEPEVEQKKVIQPEVVSARAQEQSQQPQQPSQAIQPITPQTGLVAPVCSVEESVRIFKEFEQAKSKILTGNDVLWIGDDGRPTIEGQGKPYIKRSGWRKLARFFGLSWDIEDIKKLAMENGGYMYKVRVKVWHPAGASVISEGVTTSKNPFFSKGGRKEPDEGDILMTATTVAVNRGITDILGGGEVSGEEVE